MDTPNIDLPDAPDLELGILVNFDSIEKGYELLRRITRDEVAPLPGEDITEDACELLTALEEGHRQSLTLLYNQATALDRLRRKLCEVYGLDYEALIEKKAAQYISPAEALLRDVYKTMEVIWIPGDAYQQGAEISAEMADRLGSFLGFGAFGARGATGEKAPEPENFE